MLFDNVIASLMYSNHLRQDLYECNACLNLNDIATARATQ